MAQNASAKEIDALSKAWGDKPCNHDAGLLKEYSNGMATGDYCCEICGHCEWGARWNIKDEIK
ncbi:hypothetical protein D3C87_931600 [compost metagenome]